jgi:hypothetical protein
LCGVNERISRRQIAVIQRDPSPTGWALYLLSRYLFILL